MAIRIEVYHYFGPDPRLDQIIAQLGHVEAHLANQDQVIQAFKDAVTAQFTALSASVDTITAAQANIAADEANILAQLQNLGDLTPANQAVLDGIVSDLTSVVSP